jgi:tetratricopeptide (TPR) repeat protein
MNSLLRRFWVVVVSLIVLASMPAIYAQVAAQESTPEPTLSAIDQLIAKANLFLSDGKYEQAIDAYTDIIKLDPDRIDAYLNRGEAYRWQGDYNHVLTVPASPRMETSMIGLDWFMQL